MSAFSDALNARMAEREVGPNELARVVGVSRQIVRQWVSGEYLPRTKNAYRIAEALDSSLLYGLVTKERRTLCRQCKRPIVSGSSSRSSGRRVWCGSTCRDRFRYKRTPRVDPALLAIAAMCRQCEPSGKCSVPACPLRRFSPYPLVDGVVEGAKSGTRNHIGTAA